MTLQDIGGSIMIPDNLFGTYGAPQYQNVLIDAAAEKVGFIFRIPKSGTISKIGFRTGTVATGDTIKIGLYTVDTSTGMPTVTAYGGMTAGTQVVLSTDDNVAFTVSLAGNATATVGDVVAVVIEFNSFVAGSINISTIGGTGSAQSSPFPYTAQYTAAWADTTVIPVCWLQYDDGSYSYAPNLIPAASISAAAFASTATPDELALKFQIPFKARCSGFSLFCDFACPFIATLYASDGSTTAASMSIDTDMTGNLTTRFAKFLFTSGYSLTANTVYRLGIAPQTSTGMGIYQIQAHTTTALDQLPGGQNFNQSTRTDAGAWSDSSSIRPLISVLFDQLEAGGGGVFVHPGMGGGMRA